MLIFLSWSGDRSKAVAEVLSSWLSQVIQAVEPWISSDIDKGVRWSPEIADKLEKSKVGIVCLTKDNLESRWILFEAGALSKMKDAYVCTLLFDISPSDVHQPLGQFQHTSKNKDDIKQLLKTINRAVATAGEKPLADSTLDNIFETFWPKLESDLEAISKLPLIETTVTRPEREMLEEILELMRGQERRLTSLQKSQDSSEIMRNFVAHSYFDSPNIKRFKSSYEKDPMDKLIRKILDVQNSIKDSKIDEDGNNEKS